MSDKKVAAEPKLPRLVSPFDTTGKTTPQLPQLVLTKISELKVKQKGGTDFLDYIIDNELAGVMDPQVRNTLFGMVLAFTSTNSKSGDGAKIWATENKNHPLCALLLDEETEYQVEFSTSANSTKGLDFTGKDILDLSEVFSRVLNPAITKYGIPSSNRGTQKPAAFNPDSVTLGFDL